MSADTQSPQPPQTDPSVAWVPIFHALGLPAYHVRAEGRIACIEAPPADFARLLHREIRAALVKHGKALGYLFITLDMG
jgi:hypothetical protein